MDQTTFAYKNLLQNIPGRRLHANLDSRLLIIAKKRYGLVPSLNSISNSIGQALFRRADIRELYNQQTLPVNVPEAGAVEQLTLW